MEPPAAHAEVAAFVLGVLDEEENEIFEAHLADCADCQAELRELYVMPPILDEARRIDPSIATGPEPSPAVLTGLLDNVTEQRRRRRRATYLTAAAAAAVIAITPVATRMLWPGAAGEQGRPIASSPVHATGTEILQATNRSNAVTAKITIQPEQWGTQVGIELYGVRGPLHCQLVVVTHTGKNEVVTSWQVPADKGWGVPSNPNPLRLEGSTAYLRADIDRFEFRTTTGPNILNVPA